MSAQNTDAQNAYLQMLDAGPQGPEKTLQVKAKKGQTKFAALAENAMSPVGRAVVASHPWVEKSMGETGINEAMAVISLYAEQAAAGDLTAAKQMLMVQAMTLDAISTKMTRLAAAAITEKADGTWSMNHPTMQVTLGFAMKAQSQCRATLQTLGEMVNPRSVAFIKADQANVANGPQQVNNGPTGQDTTTRAREIAEPANKLLEANPSERLDFGAQAAPGGVNSALATVGAVHRPQDGTGQVHRLPKRDEARRAKR